MWLAHGGCQLRRRQQANFEKQREKKRARVAGGGPRRTSVRNANWIGVRMAAGTWGTMCRAMEEEEGEGEGPLHHDPR